MAEKQVAEKSCLDGTLDESSMRTMASLLGRIKDLDDQKSWGDFYKRYHMLVRAMAWSFIRNHNLRMNEQDVEDIVIDVMTGVSRQIGEFEYQPGKRKFRSYLATTTRRRCIDALRKKMVRPSSSADMQKNQDGLDIDVADDDMTGDIEKLMEDHDMEIGRAVALDKLRRDKRVTVAQYQVFERLAMGDAVAGLCSRLGIKPNQVYIIRTRVLPHYEQALREAKAELDAPSMFQSPSI